MSTSDQNNVCAVVQQRTRFLSLLSPPPRYTPQSFYPQYTQAQLDMRRKAEILQYNKNSTQTSKLTKSQRFSQMVNANTKTSVICQKNYNVLTPSSSCDVPGPLTYLHYDPAVPLYNYVSKQDVYAEFTQPVPPTLWVPHFTTGSLVATNKTETLFFTLTIQDVAQSIYTFDLNVPIGIYLSGTGKGSTASGNITISSATLNVYFYGSPDTTPPYYSRTYDATVPGSTYPHLMDISCSFITNPNLAPFSGSQYLGNLDFPGITLKTQYGFVYDFKLTFTVNNKTNLTNQTNLANFSYGAYMNFPNYDTSGNNCTVTPQSPPVFGNYLPFSLTAPT